MVKNKIPKRGDIYFADLDPVVGSEQGGTRPILIIQNDRGNSASGTVIVAILTTRMTKAKLPTHVEIDKEDTKIRKDSIVMLEQIRTIDKKRLINFVDSIGADLIKKIDKALRTSLNLN